MSGTTSFLQRATVRTLLNRKATDSAVVAVRVALRIRDDKNNGHSLKSMTEAQQQICTL
jgi:hypothetical protein